MPPDIIDRMEESGEPTQCNQSELIEQLDAEFEHFMRTQQCVDCLMQDQSDDHCISWPDLFDESMRLATANDVLRAEVAELKATIQPGCCGIATCPGVAEARQEVAREIVDMLFDTEFEGPNKAKFEKVVAAFISHIKSKFKLEG